MSNRKLGQAGWTGCISGLSLFAICWLPLNLMTSSEISRTTNSQSQVEQCNIILWVSTASKEYYCSIQAFLAAIVAVQNRLIKSGGISCLLFLQEQIAPDLHSIMPGSATSSPAPSSTLCVVAGCGCNLSVSSVSSYLLYSGDWCRLVNTALVVLS